jgi:8-oxo-dGTP diphosphatase
MSSANRNEQRISAIDWASVPVFGPCGSRDSSVVRPSAYGILTDRRSRLALARNAHGVFLPGGGIEPGETPAETISREADEECGLVVRPAAWTVQAIEYVYADAERTLFQKRSTFIAGECECSGAAPSEPGYELVWIDPEAAIGVLSHESHRWAVRQWLQSAPRV